MKKVFLGMSGGVDSSASAALLKAQGYDVVGVYMKNWSEDLPGMKCPWAEDLADAKRVAVKLDLPLEVWDFEQGYKTAVVDYMLAEFSRGRTPNPDIICNQEIKFKLFFDEALRRGADFIATGHYARQQDGCLYRAIDENKDQTYFLYRMSPDALARTLFPIGEMCKPEVKKYAESQGLANAYKKESMGLCFVGEVGIKDFLKHYLQTEPGPIIEAENGRTLGHHDGALFYTIGQRHGLFVGGGLPYYVVGKDLTRNEVYVSSNLNHPNLWTDRLRLEDCVWLSTPPDFNRAASSDNDTATELGQPDLPLLARLRHRGELIPCALAGDTLVFDRPVSRPAPGQSAVLYSGPLCLGGGIIAE